MVTRIEIGLADVLDTKLGRRGAGRVRTIGVASYRRGKRQEENLTKTQQRKIGTQKQRRSHRETRAK